MAAEEDKSSGFYAVLGLKKECTAAELRNAYKKLAMKWHPDRFSACGNSKHVEEAKKKFQAIQQAYSVLSDADQRFLYDFGVYDCNEDYDESGMGDFLNEMAAMMSQTKSDGNGDESFEELQELFDKLFQSDMELFGSSSRSATPPMCSASSSSSSSSSLASSDKMNFNGLGSMSGPGPFEGFCIGLGGSSGGAESSRRKNTRKGTRR